jgi:CHAD domain-containing protein
MRRNGRRPGPLDTCDAVTLTAGSERAYRRGRDAFRAALDDPSAERLHDWRKRAKDLWYHQRLLRDAWPGPLKAFAAECDALGSLLGDDHDLATLAELLGGDFQPPPSVDTKHVLELIAARRGELQAEAFELGRRVYAEKPKAFGRRLGRYLAATREPLPA